MRFPEFTKELAGGATAAALTLPIGIVPASSGAGSPTGGSFEYVDFSSTTTYTGSCKTIKGSGTDAHRIGFQIDGTTTGPVGNSPNIAVGALDRLVWGCFFNCVQAALL